MNIVRTTTRSRGNKNKTKGTHAVGICERSGFKYPLKNLVIEPGTNYLVYKNESDELKNLVSDPLNFPSEKLKKPEGMLKYTSPDTPLTVGTVVSVNDLVLLEYQTSVQGNFIGVNE